MKKALVLLTIFALPATAAAQSGQGNALGHLSYTYGELRFVDVDSNGGDGFQLAGSFELDGDWILVGSLTSLDFNNNVDSTLLEVGGGYVWDYTDNFDLFTTLRLAWAEVDTPVGDADDTGFAFSAGTRGFLAPKFEIRGSVNHTNLGDSDTYLTFAGDYYFTDQVSAGISLDFAGDTDSFSIGGRWYFK
jgi:hypothetical protein